MPDWPIIERDATGTVEPDLLDRLVRGDVAVVVLRGLLPEADFAGARAQLRQLFAHAVTTRYVNGALTTIGPYLAKYLDDPNAYFAAATEAQALVDAAGFDLAARVRDGLRKTLAMDTLEPAVEPDGRRYGEAVVRVHADGVANPLHNDNIMRDAATTGLRLAGLTHQLSCVVCVEECDSGGELRIYRRPWQPTDEQFKIEGGLGYRAGVVDGCASATFRPQAGDVYLLNPTQYHEIARVTGSNRTTLGFFIGFRTASLADAVVWG